MRTRRRTHRNKSDLRSESGAKPKKKKKRYVENQKEKFRKSREWKEFRAKMAILFNHRDYITGKKLVKGFNVHHMRTEQDEEHYCDISNEKEFIPLNSQCHKLLHYLFTYYQKDRTVMDRLVEILDKMCELNPKYSVEPIVEPIAIEEPQEKEEEQEVREVTSKEEVTSEQQQLPQSM